VFDFRDVAIDLRQVGKVPEKTDALAADGCQFRLGAGDGFCSYTGYGYFGAFGGQRFRDRPAQAAATG
jgi:hypothetical protein